MKNIVKQVIFWRIGLLLITLIGIRLLPFTPTFPYAETLLEPQGHPAFWSFANFDGVHYLGIAKGGYFAQFTQAFFPLYPLLIKTLSLVFQNLILSSYIISLSSLIGFIYILKNLICLDHNQQVANYTILFFLLFPTSFFLTATYTESFFMMLVVAAFYSARKKNWWFAGLLGAIASATRLFGILLLPALLIELWQQNRQKNIIKFIQKTKTQILNVFTTSIGLLAYMRYLHTHFSDAFYFLNAQPAFGAERSASKLILLYQVFWRYIKMLFTVNPKSLLYFTISQEFLFSLIFLGLLLYALKKIRLSYVLFGLFSYIVPTLTGTLSSMPRYVLVAFPAFMLLGQIKSRSLRILLYALSSMLLAINTILFTRGLWVA